MSNGISAICADSVTQATSQMNIRYLFFILPKQILNLGYKYKIPIVAKKES